MADPGNPSNASFDIIMECVARVGHRDFYIYPTPEKAEELGLSRVGHSRGLPNAKSEAAVATEALPRPFAHAPSQPVSGNPASRYLDIALRFMLVHLGLSRSLRGDAQLLPKREVIVPLFGR